MTAEWPEGAGELTGIGERQHYTMGLKARKSLIEEHKFLPETYDIKSIYAQSSDYNRTKQAAQAHLLGLYPLGTGSVFTNETERQFAALPPFELDSRSKKVISQKNVTISKFNVINSKNFVIPYHLSC